MQFQYNRKKMCKETIKIKNTMRRISLEPQRILLNKETSLSEYDICVHFRENSWHRGNPKHAGR